MRKQGSGREVQGARSGARGSGREARLQLASKGAGPCVEVAYNLAGWQGDECISPQVLVSGQKSNNAVLKF